MKDDTLLLKKEHSFWEKMGQQKSAVMACLAVVILVFALYLGSRWGLGDSVLMVMVPVLFLLAGMAHLVLMDRKLPAFSITEKWTFTLLLSVMLLALLSASRLLNNTVPWQQVLGGTAAFLLPFTLADLWRLHVLISYSGARQWQPPVESATDFHSIYLTGIPVRFQIIQESQEESIGVIPFLASGRMTLGDVFCDMTQKQVKKGLPAVTLKSSDTSGWIFFTNDFFFWNRALDPHQSLYKNRVGKNAVIYAQRVSREPLHPVKQANKEQNVVL
jgi:hypothetical protein